MQRKSYILVKSAYALVCGDRFVVGNHGKPVTAAEQYFFEFFFPAEVTANKKY